MERQLVVWCPALLEEGEHGREARAFRSVVEALAAFAARVDPVRPGVCAVPTRGPARYFGGDHALAELATAALAGLGAHAPRDPGGVGIADGLFAAGLAARAAVGGPPRVVPPGETPAFLAPWPVAALDRPELADLLGRLGVRTLGAFVALPVAQVLARFGTDGARCQRVAAGVEGELPGFRLCFPPRTPPPGRTTPPVPVSAASPGTGPGAGPPVRQPGFWGDTADIDARAGRAVADVQRRLGPEAAVRATVQGGRGPAQRARFVPWTGPGAHPDGDIGGPWPGQVPPPAPATVLDRPRPAELADAAGRTVGVSGGGMVSAAPARLSVDGGAWTEIAEWAGPWPADERWWSPRSRRRQARMQIVTVEGTAHLLTRERGGWWLEAIYD